MQVDNKLLTIFRILESLPKVYPNERELELAADKINKVLNDNDRAVLTNIVKAMVLMTSGNVKTVRNPENFKNESLDSWVDLLGHNMDTIIDVLNLPLNRREYPNMEDYRLANKLLPILGGSSIAASDVDRHAGSEFASDRASGHKTLFRGIKRLNANTILYAMQKPSWDILRSVSTSVDFSQAKKFAGAENSPFGTSEGPAIIFTIDNQSKRGLHAGSLSRFQREDEVILAGTMDIVSWTLEVTGWVKYPWDDMSTTCQIICDSESESAVVKKRGRKVLQQLEFPREGESFYDFYTSVIKGRPFVIIDEEEDEELEVNVQKFTALLRANAVLK